MELEHQYEYFKSLNSFNDQSCSIFYIPAECIPGLTYKMCVFPSVLDILMYCSFFIQTTFINLIPNFTTFLNILCRIIVNIATLFINHFV